MSSYEWFEDSSGVWTLYMYVILREILRNLLCCSHILIASVAEDCVFERVWIGITLSEENTLGSEPDEGASLHKI